MRLLLSFHPKVNLLRVCTEKKLHAHTASAVKQREPGIQALQSQYNKLCDELAKLIRIGKAIPRGAVAPERMESKDLWTLDVGDAIWQDIGLDDGSDDTKPPRWLADDSVRKGIRAVLQLKRCEEEEAFLVQERTSAQVWFAEEWQTVTKAWQIAGKVYSYVILQRNSCFLQTIHHYAIALVFDDGSCAICLRLGSAPFLPLHTSV